MQFTDGIFYILVLIMSVVIHEFAHGYTAYLLGDNTARDRGRLTLNPIKHLDLIGSVILPLVLLLSGSGFLIGWAKPVPYNPNNLRNIRKGTFWVSIAGILANIFVAVIFGLLIRVAPNIGLPTPFYNIASMIVFLNLILALFNIIPIPPLDGSKILFSILPYRYRQVEFFLERYGLFILLLFIFLLWGKVAPLIYNLFNLLTGLAL